MESKKLIKLTTDLVRFKTTKDNYEERKKIISFVREQFEGKNVYMREFDHGKTPSIVVTLGKNKRPRIFLNGHLDVVPAKDKYFLPVIRKDRIYGRGTGDMKAACAVMIEVVKYFSTQKKRPSLGLMLTTDEEIGGKNGAGYLLEKQKFLSEFAIIPDGGADLREIILNQKGVLHLKIKTYGKPAHGSRPFLGENAIEKIIKGYLKLRKIIPELKTDRWRNTMNLGKFSGGDAINKVPDYAEMYLDIRFIKREDRDKIFQKIKKVFPDTELVSEGNPFIQYRHRHVAMFKKILERNIGQRIIFSRVEGASDARYFSGKGIPTIITKIKAGNIHSDNEWVDIKEMKIFYDSLVEFIGEF